MTRQQVLETFLNDKVTFVQKGLFVWRGIYYEVIPYNAIMKDKRRKVDHFVRTMERGVVYCIRELSKPVLKKFYSIDY